MQEKNKLVFKIISLVFGMVFLVGAVYQSIALFSTPPKTFASVELLIAEASKSIQNNDYEHALKHLEKAKQLQEEETKHVDPHTYTLLGEVTHKLGRLPEAVRYYQQSLKHDPALVVAHEELAIIYGKQKKFALAEKELDWVLQQNPKNIFALNNLGVAYFQQNKLAQSEKMFLRVLAVRDDFTDAYRNLGYLYKMQKNTQKSREYFAKYLKLSPQAPDAAEIKKLL